MIEDADTFPKLLLKNREKYGGTQIAMRKKDRGIWRCYTWEDCYQNIKELSLGLIQLGLKRGDKVCILGDNDPEWYWAELAVQSAGAIPIGIFIDSIPPEVKYIAEHSKSSFAFAKDQEQCDKFLEIAEELPLMKKVIYWDPKGMWSYDAPLLISFEEVQRLGKAHDKEHSSLFEENIGKGNGKDSAVFCYTSATTGVHPKGAMLSYDYFGSVAYRGTLLDPMYDNDEYLSFSPGAWAVEQGFGIGYWLLYGMKVNFPEEPETTLENIREIGACFLLFSSRQWHDLYSKVQVRMNDASVLKRFLYNLFLPVGYKVTDSRLHRWQNPSLLWRSLYQVGDWLIFRPIRDYLGLSKLKMAIAAGTLLGPDIFTWFHAVGVPVKDMYGLTEGMFITHTAKERIKAGTSGYPAPGTNLRIADDGELLVKAENMCEGYYENPEANDKAYHRGWFRTGDCCHLDEDGYLVILDRVKDMMTLKDGSKYSPTYIENALTFSPYAKDAMAIGSDKDFVSVIVNLDFENAGKWAEKHRIAYTTFADLSQKPELYELILKEVNRVNTHLPVSARVKRYCLLHKEFDPDEGELTRTKKLRRWFLEDRYKDLIAAIYSGQDKMVTEAQVKYRDGRQGKIVTSIRVADVAGLEEIES